MPKDQLIPYLKIVAIYLCFYMLLSRMWVGEDAFIFFRYIDNFVNGNGLVFNIGERVEGFTSPLWVFVLAIFRYFFHFPLRPFAIFLGLALSIMALAVLVVKDHQKKSFFFPLGTLLLITNSAFKDFATSGFETALTYLLLIVLTLHIKNTKLEKGHFVTGLLATLLVLNRPEAFLLYAYVFGVLALRFLITFVKNVKVVGTFKFPLKSVVSYLLPFLTLAGGYQVFRMGYYVSLFPNTFYAKKGGELYFSQGLNYVKDFIFSYKLTFLILGIVMLFFVLNLFGKWINDEITVVRTHLLLMCSLLLGYVLYSGADYMHGRSLLMFFILLVVALNDFVESAALYVFGKIVRNPVYLRFNQVGAVIFLGMLFVPLSLQKPITVIAKRQLNNINDERTHFGVTFSNENIKSYLFEEITGEFGWRDRGFYYKDIVNKLDITVSVVNPNIGFFGYSGGYKVSVFGATLIDPYIARQAIVSRGKIGHENNPQWEYVLSRKPTFSYTPFKQWNDASHFKYKDSQYSHVIKDDSNDSFVPIFDLSNAEFLNRYSAIVGVDVKKAIDDYHRSYLINLPNVVHKQLNYNINEYLGFMRIYWYPYANQKDKQLFDSTIKQVVGSNRKLSSYEIFIANEKPLVDEFSTKISGTLTWQKFIDNIIYVVRSI